MEELISNVVCGDEFILYNNRENEVRSLVKRINAFIRIHPNGLDINLDMSSVLGNEDIADNSTQFGDVVDQSQNILVQRLRSDEIRDDQNVFLAYDVKRQCFKLFESNGTDRMM